MSFSKAHTKRFNEVESCAPPVGTYDPKDAARKNGVALDKDQRFKEPKPIDLEASISLSSSCSSLNSLSPSNKRPPFGSTSCVKKATEGHGTSRGTSRLPTVSKRVITTSSNLAKERAKIKELEHEIKRLHSEKADLQRMLEVKDEEFGKKEGHLFGVIREKTSLEAKLKITEKQLFDMEACNQGLKKRAETADANIERIRQLQQELNHARSDLARKESEANEFKKLLQQSRAKQESDTKTMHARLENKVEQMKELREKLRESGLREQKLQKDLAEAQENAMRQITEVREHEVEMHMRTLDQLGCIQENLQSSQQCNHALQQYRESLQTELNDANNVIAKLRSECQGYEEYIRHLKGEIFTLKDNILQEKDELVRTQLLKDDVDARLQDAVIEKEEVEQRLKEMSEDYTQLKEQFATLQDDYSRDLAAIRRELQARSATVRERERALHTLGQEHDELRLELNQQSEARSNAEKQLVALQSSLTEKEHSLQLQLSEVRSELDSTVMERNNLGQVVQDLKKFQREKENEMKEMKGYIGKVETDQQEVGKMVEKMEREKGELQEDQTKLICKLQDLQAAYEKMQSNLSQEIHDLKLQNQRMASEKETLKQEADELAADLKDKTEEAENLAEEKDQLQHDLEVANVENDRLLENQEIEIEALKERYEKEKDQAVGETWMKGEKKMEEIRRREEEGLARVRQEAEERAEEMRGEHHQLMEELRRGQETSMEQLKLKQEQELKSAKREHAQRTEQLQREQEQKVKELQRETRQKMEQLEKVHKADLQQVKQERQQRIAEAVWEKENKLKLLGRENEELRERVEQQDHQLEEQGSKLEQMQKDHSRELEKLQARKERELQQICQESDHQMELLQIKHQEEMTSMRAQQDQEINKVKREYEDSIEQMMEEEKEVEEKSRSEHAKQLDQLQKEQEREIEGLRDMLADSDLSLQKVSKELELTHLALNNAQDQLDKEEKRSRELEDAFEQTQAQLDEAQRQSTELLGKHAELQVSLAEAEQCRLTLEQQLESLEHEYDNTLMSRDAALSNMHAELEQVKLQLEKQSSNFRDARDLLDTRGKELTRLREVKRDLEDKLSQVEELKVELAARSEKVAEVQGQLLAAREENEKLKQHKEEMDKCVEEEAQALRMLKEELVTCSNDRSELRDELERNKKQLDQAEGQLGRSQVAEQQAKIRLLERSEQLEKLQDEMASLKTELSIITDGYQSKISSESETKNALQLLMKEFEQFKETHRGKDADIRKLQRKVEELSEVEEKLQQSRNDNLALRKQMDHLSDEKHRSDQACSSADARAERLKAELADALGSKSQVAELRDEMLMWRSQYEALEQQVEPFKEQLARFQAERDAIEGQNHEALSNLERLSTDYAKLLGHQNQKQKIRHILQLKDDNVNLRKKVGTLETRSSQQALQIRNLEEQLSKAQGKKRFDHRRAFEHSADQSSYSVSSDKENEPTLLENFRQSRSQRRF